MASRLGRGSPTELKDLVTERQDKAMDQSIEPNSNDSASRDDNRMSESQSLINRSVSEPQRQWNLEGSLERVVRPCIAEFIGTALFVFIGTTTICAGGVTLEGIALAHGFVIALLVMATASISGAHFNPAVTLGIFIAGAVSPLQAALYILSQTLGAVLGAAFTMGVIGAVDYGGSDCNGGGHVPSSKSTPGEAVLCEVLLTYLLVITVLVSAVDDGTKSNFFPLAIGFAVTVDILAGGAVSGASMNPARSFGPALVANHTNLWDYNWIYWVGPAIGSLLAGITYRLILASPEKRAYGLFSAAFSRK